MDEQTKIEIDIIKGDLSFNWYSKYKDNKSCGCIYYWIYIYFGLDLSENCCAHEDKVTVSPYSEEIIGSYIWVEDKPNVFRPKFEFFEKYKSGWRKQEIYEKYLK